MCLVRLSTAISSCSVNKQNYTFDVKDFQFFKQAVVTGKTVE